MDNPGEILRLCRLCLVKDQVNIPIFEEQGDIRQIFLKISSCLPVTVSRDDQLPKKICDGCSNKLDLLYEFWNTSANAEKTLLSWLGQAGVKDADETISAVAQQIKPAETQVKEEALEDGHAISQDNFGLQSFDEDTKDEAEPPPRKRARRTAAVKAQISIAPESDDDDDDMDNTEAMTKVEGESEESDGEDRDPSYGEVPGTSADDQAGPSGVGKDGVEAPHSDNKDDVIIVLSDDDGDSNSSNYNDDSSDDNSSNDVIRVDGNDIDTTDEKNNKGKTLIKRLYCNKCGDLFNSFERLHRHIFSNNHIFTCENCDQKVGHTLTQLRQHIRSGCNQNEKEDKSTDVKRHINNPKYYCERCGEGFNLLSKLSKHYGVHLNELICCSLCPIRTATFDDMITHFKSHTVVNNIELICNICDLKFFAVNPYYLHCVLVHSTFIDISYKCVICPQTFKNDREFLWHVQSHTKIVTQTNKNIYRPDRNVSSLTCEICARTFKSINSCKEHRSEIHDIEVLRQETRVCPVCSETFTILEMYNHMLQHQQMKGTNVPLISLEKGSKKNTKVKCYTCKEMVLLSTIELHRESHKFKCNQCLRSFNTEQGLNHHSLSHSNNESSSLNDVYSSTPVKPHACEVCGKRFPTVFAVLDHNKSHMTSSVSPTVFSECTSTSYSSWTERDSFKFNNWNNPNAYESLQGMQNSFTGSVSSYADTVSSSFPDDHRNTNEKRKLFYEPPSDLNIPTNNLSDIPTNDFPNIRERRTSEKLSFEPPSHLDRSTKTPYSRSVKPFVSRNPPAENLPSHFKPWK